MGCDIHVYIEAGREYKGKKSYHLWAHPNFSRSYVLFGLLSKGVRWDTELGMEPRGIPEDIDYYTSKDYFYTVDDDRAAEQGDDYEGRFCTAETAEKYAKYGAQYIPARTREDGYVFPPKVANPDWHSASWLSLSELEEVIKRWRSLPLWSETHDLSQVRVEEGVTLEQLKENLAKRIKARPSKMKTEILGLRDGWAMYRHTYKQRREGVSKDLLASIGAMRALRTKNCEPRLVFWFDN